MPTINLEKKGISIDGAEFKAIAPNLQCNILKSHSRANARLLFLNFQAKPAPVKEWIKAFISKEKYVVSALDQKADSAAFKITKSSKTVVNFYLSANGYEKLGFKTDKFTDGHIDEEDRDEEDEEIDKNRIYGNNSFVKGMKSKTVVKKLKDPKPDKWEQGYNTDIHAMILLADDDADRLNTEAIEVKNSLAAIAAIVQEETGAGISEQLPNGAELHLEHFGYADGISQPRYFTEDRRTSPIDLQPLSLVLVKDPFTNRDDNNFGSFLVYRKLEQDVEGFNARVAELAEHLNLNDNQQGKISKEDFAGALVVGRFKDGTPLVKTDIPLGETPVFNDFKYEHTDRGAHKCPFHAHIRKTNPRGQGILVSEKGRFITRRGIPYGRRNSTDKKGLLFMCFQANLKRQFNFIQKAWSNAPGFPPLRGKPGIDPLIGQGNKGGQRWPKSYDSNEKVKFDFAGFVHMKGGEYFFAPSIGFLNTM
jgi:Dyp-type peroxidase family